MKTPIYLDYLATTPVDPRVAQKLSECLTLDGNFGNPASRSHRFGWLAEQAVEMARRQLADLIGADPREIVYTSGATEADNLAIKGVVEASPQKCPHIVTTAIEHKAVLDTCKHLEEQGCEVTYLVPDRTGIIDPAQVQAALRDNTVLVSIMHANNEIGTVNDIAAIGAITAAAQVPLHVDAAQSVGKINIDVEAMQIDLLSASGHKFYGPKGIGILYVRRSPRIKIAQQIHGGGHERGMRSGTLPTHQIVAIGEAARLAGDEMEEEAQRLVVLRDVFWRGIGQLEDVGINGSLDSRLPGALNVHFGYVEGESLLMALKDLAISSGSACTSASLEPSYVLKALGLSDELAHSSLRFSFGRFTSEEEARYAAEQVVTAVNRLREGSSQWENRALSESV
ncbi:MAG: IscS subfamily cysteine desulfurase [Halioglobus sp.]